MNLTGYMEGKNITAQLFLDFIQDNCPVCRTNPSWDPLFSPQRFTSYLFQMSESLQIFLLSSAPQKSKDLCYIQYKDHHRLQKKILLQSCDMTAICIVLWFITSTKIKAICLHITSAQISSVMMTAWGFSSFCCHVKEIPSYLKYFFRKVYEVPLVTMRGYFI